VCKRKIRDWQIAAIIWLLMFAGVMLVLYFNNITK
jgi:hypothetical protein